MHEIRAIVTSPEGRRLIAPKKGRKAAASGSLAAIAIQREEVRRCDQRREDRQLRSSQPVTITFRRRRHEAQLVNISSHGAMIACDLLPRIGETIEIRFDDANRTKATVRWIRDGRIGTEFRSETVVLAPPAVRQHIFGTDPSGPGGTNVAVRQSREQRHGFIWRGTIHWPSGQMPARLRNISEHGAMVECDRDVDAGTAIVLDLGPAGAASGTVRWSRSGQVGLAFEEAFDMRGLAAARPAGEASPAMVKPRYLETDGQPDSPWAAAWDKFTPDQLG